MANLKHFIQTENSRNGLMFLCNYDPVEDMIEGDIEVFAYTPFTSTDMTRVFNDDVLLNEQVLDSIPWRDIYYDNRKLSA